MWAKTSIRRNRRGHAYSPLVITAIGAILVITSVIVAQNRHTVAANNAPSWGNDGLGVVFSDNNIVDNESRQLGTAVVGEWVEYSIKLNAKQYVNGHLATNYLIEMNSASLESFAVLDTLSTKVIVAGEEQEYERQPLGDSGSAKDWSMVVVPWADVEHDGVCHWMPLHNERPELSDSEISFNAKEDCVADPGAYWEENEGIKNVTPLLDDAEIEIVVRFKLGFGFDALATADDIAPPEIKLPVRFAYSYYDEQDEIERLVADEETSQMISEAETELLQRIDIMEDTSKEAVFSNGNLLIRRVDENGAPIAGVKIMIDGIKANNRGGTMFANAYGMFDTFETNERGEVLIRGVKYGTYTIREVEAADEHEELHAPQTQSVSRETMKAQTYSRYILSSSILEQLATQQGASSPDIGTMFQFMPNGDLFTSQNEGDDLILRLNEETGRYDISVDGYKTNWYAEKVSSEEIDIVLPNLSANIRLISGEDDGIYYYTPEGSSVSLAYQISETDGVLSIAPTASGNAGTDEESSVSFLRRNDSYVVRNGSSDEYTLPWNEENGMYIYGPRFSETSPTGLAFVIYEEPDGTLSIAQSNGDRASVADSYSYNEEQQRWEGIDEETGTNTYIWKEEGCYFFVYANADEQMGYVLTYSDDVGGYIVDPTVFVMTLREIDDETVFIEQGMYFEKVGQNRWFGVLLFFPLIIDGTYEESTIMASEAVLANERSATLDQPRLPEDIVNPQTSDIVLKSLAVIALSITPIAIVRKQLSKR